MTKAHGSIDFEAGQRFASPHGDDGDGKPSVANRAIVPARPAAGVWTTAGDATRTGARRASRWQATGFVGNSAAASCPADFARQGLKLRDRLNRGPEVRHSDGEPRGSIGR